MHIRKILEIMEIDLERCRIELYRTDFNKYACDFSFELPDESWNPWAIILPDTDHITVYQNSAKFQPEFLKAMIKMIHDEVPESMEYDDEIVFTVFSILHEIGHLCNYENKHMSKRDYINEEYPERTRVLQIKEFDTAFKEYRNLPNEKAADQFAFKYMIEELRKIVSTKE